MVIWSEPGRADLRSIHGFIAHDSRHYANPSLSLHPIISWNNSDIVDAIALRYGTTVCDLRCDNGLLCLAWIPRQLQGAQQDLL